MKITQITNTERTFHVVSNNKLIEVNLVENHTELILDDSSIIIFTNLRDYYKFNVNTDIFNPIKQEVNILLLANIAIECITDTVSNYSYAGKNVSSVSKFTVDDYIFYYITRTKKG